MLSDEIALILMFDSNLRSWLDLQVEVPLTWYLAAPGEIIAYLTKHEQDMRAMDVANMDTAGEILVDDPAIHDGVVAIAQGIGISAAGMYAQLTTGKPVQIISRTSARATHASSDPTRGSHAVHAARSLKQKKTRMLVLQASSQRRSVRNRTCACAARRPALRT